MTLQYRRRSTWEYERWRQRNYLCRQLLLQQYDHWCRAEADFPVQRTIAGILYLYSPRIDPDQVSESRLPERLNQLAASPEAEYQLTWPQREPARGQELIIRLAELLTEAVAFWQKDDETDPSCQSLTERIAEELMQRQYVVFHHNMTTKRDRLPAGKSGQP